MLGGFLLLFVAPELLEEFVRRWGSNDSLSGLEVQLLQVSQKGVNCRLDSDMRHLY